MDLEEERQRTRRISREFSRAMKEISGMDVPTQTRGLNTFESAMKKGDASFTADDGKSSGTLSILGEKIKISDPDQASLYKGIQDRAKSKRG